MAELPPVLGQAYLCFSPQGPTPRIAGSLLGIGGALLPWGSKPDPTLLEACSSRAHVTWGVRSGQGQHNSHSFCCLPFVSPSAFLTPSC